MKDFRFATEEEMSLREKVAELKQQRDELLVVMHGIIRAAEIAHCEWGDMRLDKITNLARAATRRAIVRAAAEIGKEMK